MCLTTVDKKLKAGSGVGYKVFENKTDGLFLSIQYKEKPYLINRWVTDQRGGPIEMGWTGKHYPTGFHIFATKKDADYYACYMEAVRKVEYSNVVATGMQRYGNESLKIIVARKMKIMEEL